MGAWSWCTSSPCRPRGYSGYNPHPANLIPQLRADGLDLLRDCFAELRRDFPRLAISTEQVYGDAGEALIHASKEAALTVVGAHGTDRIAAALGSVAAEIAANSPVSVAVIHPQDPPAAGPVVVGIDDSFEDGTPPRVGHAQGDPVFSEDRSR